MPFSPSAYDSPINSSTGAGITGDKLAAVVSGTMLGHSRLAYRTTGVTITIKKNNGLTDQDAEVKSSLDEFA